MVKRGRANKHIAGVHKHGETDDMGAMAEAIERNLQRGLSPQRLEVQDDSARHAGHAGHRPEGETHFNVTVVSAAFGGKSRVARQRLVYDLLKAEFAAGLHALSVVTLTPEESAARG
jgi:BolA protein